LALAAASVDGSLVIGLDAGILVLDLSSVPTGFAS
jgi:hypothetical protein